jgi:hypothetical protein
MQIYTNEKDIGVLCVKAASFPDGVMQAHQTLYNMLPNDKDRKFFGISYPGKDGHILYKAAAEEMFEGEAENHGLESFIIKKGKFISEFVPDFCSDTPAIGKAFKAMLSHPDIDPNGYCLELYTSATDVICMVPLLPEAVSAEK